ncbi:hypothetical protein GLGCALEP_00836 [Pseudomonas sp. MM221]|nr:hypothetical protein GLGCALEP_00836 [Pseudomonas sp. MM221]
MRLLSWLLASFEMMTSRFLIDVREMILAGSVSLYDSSSKMPPGAVYSRGK